MARVLEARRVLVQESETRTLSPSRPLQPPPSRRASTTGACESRRRKLIRGLDGDGCVEAYQFGDIFGRDVQEELVEERKVVYRANDPYGRKEYIGPLLNGKRHGEGVLIYQNNDRCEAVFEHGTLVEPTKFIRHDSESTGRRTSKTHHHSLSSSSSSSFNGNKKLRVVCVLYHDDPDGCIQYIGPVTHSNKRHGHGSLYCRQGCQFVKYEGHWENDVLRMGKVVWEEGSVYTGELQNFLPHGTGRKACAREGTVYMGQFWNGLRDGHGKLSYPNGDVLDCEFSYDKPCGQGTLTWSSGRSLSSIFTEMGLPQDCTMTATAIWWVSFFGSLTFFVYFNLWAADACAWADAASKTGRGSLRCTVISDRYPLALRLGHWTHLYDHYPWEHSLTARLAYLSSTGFLVSLDLVVWMVLLLDSVTFVINGLCHNDPFSEMHKRIAHAVYRPAVWLYHREPKFLEKFGGQEDKWTAALLVSQVLVGCTILTMVCVMNIVPHIVTIYTLPL